MKVIKIVPKINKIFPHYTCVDYGTLDIFTPILISHLKRSLVFPPRGRLYVICNT